MEQYTGEVYVQELASMLPVEASVRFMLVAGATWCNFQKGLYKWFLEFSTCILLHFHLICVSTMATSIHTGAESLHAFGICASSGPLLCSWIQGAG